MLKAELTTKQERMLSIIRMYIKKQGQSPSTEELANTIKAKSLRSVTQYLDTLEKKGYIYRKRNVSRGIELVKGKQDLELVRIPVMSSVGCDHAAIIANQEYDRFIYADPNALPKNKQVYAFQAIGDSMCDANIKNGDYVVAEKTDDVSDGDQVVALLGDAAVVKTLGRLNGARVLLPENKSGMYQPIIISEDFRLFGKVWNIVPGHYSDSMEDKIYYEPVSPE